MNKDTQTASDLVIVCQVFYPELISTGQTLTELVEELARGGLRITVIAAQPTLLPGSPRVPAIMRHKGITILRTWSTRFPKTSSLGKALNLLSFFVSAAGKVLFQNRKTQLLLLTNPPYLPILGWFCWLVRRQHFGVLLFDIMPEQAELIGFIRPNGWLAKLWRWSNGLWFKRAKYAVVLSRDMLEGALKSANAWGNSKEAAARAKTKIIHVWSDDRTIIPQPKSASAEAARLGVLDRFVVQYSGNHGRFHDIESVLGLAACFGPDDGFVFQFIGEGQKKKMVEEFLPSHPHCTSSSYVAKELLGDSLAMADLGVVAQLPGQERVCYPSKLLGIMAAGRPTLAFCPPDCEMGRMIREADIGFVVANGDLASARSALWEAREDPGRLKRMGENAARLLRDHFSLAQASSEYLQVILEHMPPSIDGPAAEPLTEHWAVPPRPTDDAV